MRSILLGMKNISLLFLALIILMPFAPAKAALSPGTLIKRACPANADVNHACKAVYFYGEDGKRHAFPNEKVFFTWYPDFTSVQTVGTDVLASLPLGSNVTYRPGAKLVKFVSLPRVYAVALGGSLRWVATEDIAQALYGATWNKQVDDISDAFYTDYRFGSDVVLSNDYSITAELAAASTINADLASTFRSMLLTTEQGSFDVDVVRLQRSRFTMKTDTANTTDCGNACAAKSLSEYAAENGASMGIHGTYFCPPDYPDCAGKTNTFLSPVYNSAAGVMINAGSLPVHEGPLIAATADDRLLFFHRTKELNTSVSAAIANYPSLVENGTVIVQNETRLNETQPSLHAIRGGMGINDRYIYLVIAHEATVTDLAYIFKELGATYALNLDGGGSAALFYEGAYVHGPGRLLPNAIIFTKK
jgi:hypothetical protein